MFLERIFFTGNQKFFNLFDELAIQITKMSSLFNTEIINSGGRVRNYAGEMAELERTTAEQVRALFMELGRNLITPFDREDIHFLTTGLNDITRNFLHIAKQIRNHNIDCSGVTKTISEQSDKAISMLALILNKLRNVKELAKLDSVCSDIRKIVYEGDDMLDDAIAQMLNEETDEIRLIKMVDHYEALQKLLGRIGDTMSVCESIIIKYA